MFAGLVDAGLLVAYPMRAVMKGFAPPSSEVNIQRSFTEAESAHVQRCIADEPVGSARMRLKCLLELLVTSGVRLEELALATWGNLRPVTLADLPPTWVLSVTGKRDKTWDVPLADEVVELLREHAECFRESGDDQAGRPLFCSLVASVHSGQLSMVRSIEPRLSRQLVAHSPPQASTPCSNDSSGEP